ncbi:MAG: hypothetical protein II868_09610, partial [Butyrivibrio sp.]|nr:hypothetical protein [Butyrivibrio sp.]
MSLIEKIVGTHSERELKRIEGIIREIESYRDRMMQLSDTEMRAKTDEFKRQLAEGRTLDDILPEAYALVREAGRRVFQLDDKETEDGEVISAEEDPMYGKRDASFYDPQKHGMEHFRVQLIGGVVLPQGRIAEMRTGEGKTLVATLPSYLNALEGKGVHVVTV